MKSLSNCERLEMQMAIAMPKLAASENEACAERWDVARWDDAPRLGKSSADNRARHKRIVAHIAKHGPITRRQIELDLDLKESAVSQVLQRAQINGEVKAHRNGRNVWTYTAEAG